MVIDLQTGRIAKRYLVDKAPRHCVHRQGRWYLGGGFAESIAVLDGSTGELQAIGTDWLRFSPTQVVGDRLWLFGSGYAPMDEPKFALIDLRALAVIRSRGMTITNANDQWRER